MFFNTCDNFKTLFFIQICLYPGHFCNHYVVAFFETSVLKEVRILYLLSPQLTPKPLPKVQTKASTSEVFLTNFIFENVFVTFLFVCQCSTFFLNEIFNSKPLWRHVFSIKAIIKSYNQTFMTYIYIFVFTNYFL